MEIAIQVLLGISVIAYGVFLWKSAQRWTWVMLLLVPIVYIEAAVVVGFVATSLKARAAWQKVIVDLEQRLEKDIKDERLLRFGDASAGQLGVTELDQELKELSVDGGRVWRGMINQGRQANNFVLRMPAPANPDGGEGAAAAPAATPIPDQLTLYAFAEVRQPIEMNDASGNQASILLPSAYLGEFKVNQSNAQQVSIEPLFAIASLSPSQQRGISTAQSWALYELMPVDSHVPFAKEGIDATDETIFGEMDENFIRQSLSGLPATAADEIIGNYLRDGKVAEPADQEYEKWAKVVVTADSGYKETVDDRQARSAVEGDYYNDLGQSTDSRLQIQAKDAVGDPKDPDGTVTIDKGQEFLMSFAAASEQKSAGNVQIIKELYVRPLNDYEESTRHLLERLGELRERIVVIKRELVLMQDVQTKTTAMLVEAQDTFAKLEDDRDQIVVEKTAIGKYRSELANRNKEIRSKLRSLYSMNLKLAREIEYAHKLLRQQIDNRTAAVRN